MTTVTRAPKAPSAWRRWRTARPFWGGLLVTLSGAEILLAVKAPLPVVLHVGMQGLAGYLVPILLLICGILLLVSPAQRVFYSTIAAICALASWVTSNLGGFVLGMLLGLIGSAVAFAWTADRKPRRRPGHRRDHTQPTEPAAPAEPTTVDHLLNGPREHDPDDRGVPAPRPDEPVGHTAPDDRDEQAPRPGEPVAHTTTGPERQNGQPEGP
jgi:hypothetical protein